MRDMKDRRPYRRDETLGEAILAGVFLIACVVMLFFLLFLIGG